MTALAIGMASPVLADWRITTTKDASGNPVISMTGTLEGGRGLIAQCNADGDAALALLIVTDKAPPANDPNKPGYLTIEDGMGGRWRASGSFYRHNDKLIGFRYGNGTDILMIVDGLGRAKGDVSATFELPSTGQSATWRGDSKGSTAAARQFLETCVP